MGTKGRSVRNRTPAAGLGNQLVATTTDPRVERPGIAPGSLVCDTSIFLLDDRPEKLGDRRDSNSCLQGHDLPCETATPRPQCVGLESNQHLWCFRPALPPGQLPTRCSRPVRESHPRHRFERPRSWLLDERVQGAVSENRTHADLITKEGPSHWVDGVAPEGIEPSPLGVRVRHATATLRSSCTGGIRTPGGAVNGRVPFHLATVQVSFTCCRQSRRASVHHRREVSAGLAGILGGATPHTPRGDPNPTRPQFRRVTQLQDSLDGRIRTCDLRFPKPALLPG